MNRIVGRVSAVLCALLWTGLLAAQSAGVRFTEQAWNFGTIKEEAGKVSHSFEFVNNGKTPVVIEKITVSCGCTTTQYDRQPVRPGARGQITLSYHPLGRPGPFRKEVEVAFSGSQRAVLILSGSVAEDMSTAGKDYPVQLGGLRFAMARIHMGYVPRGAVLTRAIEFYNASPKPMNVTVVPLSQRAAFDAEAVPSRVMPGAKGAVTVSYDLREADLWGELIDRFRVAVDGVAADTVFVVTAIATDDFSSMTPDEKADAPQALFSSQYFGFSDEKLGTTLHHAFTLTNEGRTPLVIRDMKLDRGVTTTLDASRTVAPGASVTFVMNVSTAGLDPGRIMRRMVLIINDPIRPLREIRITANLRR